MITFSHVVWACTPICEAELLPVHVCISFLFLAVHELLNYAGVFFPNHKKDEELKWCFHLF